MPEDQDTQRADYESAQYEERLSNQYDNPKD